MSLRPGSEAARGLWKSNDVSRWASSLGSYGASVAAVGRSRKKLKDLENWDNFVSQDLRDTTLKKLTKDELVTIVNWKLTRGKFRPLMNQVLGNSDKAVDEATEKGISLARSKDSKIKDAIEAVAALRGIGPATASAVLAPCDPARFPFMSDEALEGCGLKRDYTVTTYVEFARRLADRASSLGSEWDAEMVGRALWSCAMHSAHGLQEAEEGGGRKAGAAKLGMSAAGRASAGEGKDESRMLGNKAAGTKSEGIESAPAAKRRRK